MNFLEYTLEYATSLIRDLASLILIVVAALLSRKLKNNRLLLAIGVALACMGSFLPWTYYNGFIGSMPTRGIYLNWVPQAWRISSPRIEDHGGLLIVLLSLGMIVLINYAPRFITRPEGVTLGCAVGLVLVSAYHLARCWLEALRTWHIRDGSVSIGPGVQLVFLGALILLHVALVEWEKSPAAIRPSDLTH